MKNLRILLFATGVLICVPAQVWGQCASFSRAGACAAASLARLGIDFRPDVPLRERSAPPAGRVHVPGRPQIVQAPAPVDCQMVRWADATIDPMVVRRPPQGINFTLRLVEVPACPKPK